MSFLEKFKGKISHIPLKGVNNVLNSPKQPIDKMGWKNYLNGLQGDDLQQKEDNLKYEQKQQDEKQQQILPRISKNQNNKIESNKQLKSYPKRSKREITKYFNYINRELIEQYDFNKKDKDKSQIKNRDTHRSKKKVLEKTFKTAPIMRNIAHRKDPRMYNGNKRNNKAEENTIETPSQTTNNTKSTVNSVFDNMNPHDYFSMRNFNYNLPQINQSNVSIKRPYNNNKNSESSFGLNNDDKSFNFYNNIKYSSAFQKNNNNNLMLLQKQPNKYQKFTNPMVRNSNSNQHDFINIYNKIPSNNGRHYNNNISNLEDIYYMDPKELAKNRNKIKSNIDLSNKQNFLSQSQNKSISMRCNSAANYDGSDPKISLFHKNSLTQDDNQISYNKSTMISPYFKKQNLQKVWFLKIE